MLQLILALGLGFNQDLTTCVKVEDLSEPLRRILAEPSKATAESVRGFWPGPLTAVPPDSRVLATTGGDLCRGVFQFNADGTGLRLLIVRFKTTLDQKDVVVRQIVKAFGGSESELRVHRYGAETTFPGQKWLLSLTWSTDSGSEVDIKASIVFAGL